MDRELLSPLTGEVLRTWTPLDAGAVEAAVARAHEAWQDWRGRTLAERGSVLERVADLLESRAPELALEMAETMGKPLAQGESEAEKCAWVCRHYARHAESYLHPVEVRTEATWSGVRYDPLGVVLGIMPWNFPLWQVVRFGAPALLAGNAFLLKHAPHTFGCGRQLEELFLEAGLPRHLLTSLEIDVDQVPDLVADPRVAAVTVTGSERAGAAVAAEAGRHLKPSVLELGGSDPFIVLGDADLDRAAKVGARARLLNSGQTCIAAKRFIVQASVAEAFTSRLRAELEAAVVGDPRHPHTTVGPLARHDLRDGLHRQVQGSVALGASCVLGGVVPEGPGAFYPVTLLTDVAPGMPAWSEELFGPVAVVRVVEGVDEAIQAANDSSFGLGASLWTASRERAERLVPRLEAGAVFVNQMVKSDPRLPFGGIKRSGYGRELGREGLLQLVNTKTVWLEVE